MFGEEMTMPLAIVDEGDASLWAEIREHALASNSIVWMPWEKLAFPTGEVPKSSAFQKVPSQLFDRVNACRRQALDFLGLAKRTLREYKEQMAGSTGECMKLDHMWQLDNHWLIYHAEKVITKQVEEKRWRRSVMKKSTRICRQKKY